ncbi:MAG: CDP-alcohol phosphatidyltransferase family protein, partial [Desulfobacterales bacterium]
MIRTRKRKKERPHRGIYILPNIFTSLNLFFGFYAIIAAINGKFVAASVAIIIGVLFDIMDGKIARATNTTSKFGIEYDSLADLISFGLAPGLMIYLWSLKPLGRIGWLAAFLFMACG